MTDNAVHDTHNADDACVTVVMPCYNEAPTVQMAVTAVLESPFTRELIIVDDGSDDGSVELLRKIDHPRVRLIEQGINLGKGAALRRGFSEATSDFVIVHDADLEYDAQSYEQMLRPLIDDQADIVFGSRFSPQPHRVMYYWHAVANKALTLASNAVTNLNLTDVATGFKAFRREVIQSIELEQDRFGFDIEVTPKSARAEWRVFEVGVSYDGRTYAEGKKLRWVDGLRELYCVARYSQAGMRLTKPRLHSDKIGASLGLHEADSELESSLDNLDDAENYADWIVEMMAPYVSGDIIEIGAGHGTMSERLTRLGNVTASEPSPRAAAVLQERFGKNPLIGVAVGTADEVMGVDLYDAAVLINVLEHIPDDLGALRAIYDGLRPGGAVAIFVPAHEMLYSGFDYLIGHQRRYRRSTLAEVMGRSGFEVEELRYVNILGIIGWFAVARVLGQTPTESPLARTFDRRVIPVIRRVEQRWTMPTGLSILAVGRKPLD